MRISIYIIIAVLCPSFSFSSTLDQSSYDGDLSGGLLNAGSSSALYYREIGQTFTAGMDGTLSEIEIYGVANSDLVSDPRFQIGIGAKYESSFKELYSGQLANAALPRSTADQFRFVISLSGFSIPVSTGDSLSLTLSLPNEPSGSAGEFVWSRISEEYDPTTGTYDPAPYRRGFAYVIDTDLSPGNPSVSTQDQEWGTDFVFRSKVSQPTPVPLPAGFGLLLAGLFGLGVISRLKDKLL